jgi:hypothetical protein
MKKTFALATLIAGLVATGCTTTSPEKKYTADQPPPLAKGERAGPTEIPATKLPAAQTRASADEIDESNYQDQARRLGSEMKYEDKALNPGKQDRSMAQAK